MKPQPQRSEQDGLLHKLCPRCKQGHLLDGHCVICDEPPATDDILLPCPFCGSENVGVEPLVGGFVVDCKDCGGGCGTCHSEQAACDEWNKRKSLTEILKERGIDADKVEAEIRAKVTATDDKTKLIGLEAGGRAMVLEIPATDDKLDGVREIVNQYFGVEMSISAERAMERIAAIISKREQPPATDQWVCGTCGASATRPDAI